MKTPQEIQKEVSIEQAITNIENVIAQIQVPVQQAMILVGSVLKIKEFINGHSNNSSDNVNPS